MVSDDGMRCIGIARPQASSVRALHRSSVPMLVFDGRARIGHPWVSLFPSAIAGIGVGPRYLHVHRQEHVCRGVRATAGWGPVLLSFVLGGGLDVNGPIAFAGASYVLLANLLSEVEAACLGALRLRSRVVPLIARANPASASALLRHTASSPCMDSDPDALVVEPAIASAAPLLPRSSLVHTVTPWVGVDGRRWGRQTFPLSASSILFRC